MHSQRHRSHELIIGLWLLFCAAVVFLMVVVGGITRLTQSGLSMVEWEPIMGIVPPLNQQDWVDVFAKYRQSPEYLKVNAGMSLQEFKFIFFWEYGHRVLGRVIGMIYFVPLVFFLIKGMVPRQYYVRFFVLLLLGGAQGLMGWYMVKSGLVDVPQVSQYRLTAHLGLAIVIFACLFWYALDFLRSTELRTQVSKNYLIMTACAVVVIFVMMLSGGFVAGTKAGHIMNTFPMMNGQWLPDGLNQIKPWWLNLFENPVTIQFIHRCLAVVVVSVVLMTVAASVKQTFKTYSLVMLMALGIQFVLGISALVLKVPVNLGVAHQAGAVVLIAAALLCAHTARKAKS